MDDPGLGDETDAADLRFTQHERNNIRVDRNLAADGHIARGDKTRMSRMNFSARGRPADPGERDPVFVERETPEATEPAAAHVEPAPETIPPIPAPAPSLIHRLTGLFGRE